MTHRPTMINDNEAFAAAAVPSSVEAPTYRHGLRPSKSSASCESFASAAAAAAAAGIVPSATPYFADRPSGLVAAAESLQASSQTSFSSLASPSTPTEPTETRSRGNLPAAAAMDRIPSFYSDGGCLDSDDDDDTDSGSSYSSASSHEHDLLNDVRRPATAAVASTVDRAPVISSAAALDIVEQQQHDDDDDDCVQDEELSLGPHTLHSRSSRTPRSPRSWFASSVHTSTRTVVSSSSFIDKNHSSGCLTDDSMPSLASFGYFHDSVPSLASNPHFHDSCMTTGSSETSCDLLVPPVLPHRTSWATPLRPIEDTDNASDGDSDDNSNQLSQDVSMLLPPPPPPPAPQFAQDLADPDTVARVVVRVNRLPCDDETDVGSIDNEEGDGEHDESDADSLGVATERKAELRGSRHRTLVKDSIHHHLQRRRRRCIRNSTGNIAKVDTIPITPMRTQSANSLLPPASLHRMTNHSTITHSTIDTLTNHDRIDNGYDYDEFGDDEQPYPNSSSPRSTMILTRSLSMDESLVRGRWQTSCVHDFSPRDSLTRISICRQERNGQDGDSNCDEQQAQAEQIQEEHVVPLGQSARMLDCTRPTWTTEHAQESFRLRPMASYTNQSLSTISLPDTVSPSRCNCSDLNSQGSLSTDGALFPGEDDRINDSRFHPDWLLSSSTTKPVDRWTAQDDDSIPISPQTCRAIYQKKVEVEATALD